MKNKVKSQAVRWILKHPNCLTWDKLSIAKALKEAKIYSVKTYVRDIRVERIIREALMKMTANEKR